MVERVQVTTDENNPSLEEQAAEQENAARSKDKGSGKILGKFESYEDLEKSYTELQREYTKLKQNKSQPASQEEDDGGDDDGEDGEADEEAARQVVNNAGLDFDALSASYETNGGLTDDDYGKLEKAGIPRQIVDEFIAGQEARRTIIENQVFEAVGSKTAYGRMTEWAAENLSEDEIEIYNREVNSGNVKRIMFAVNGLKAQYERAVGFEPSRRVSGKTGGAANSAYESWAQVQADMSDPRYQNDPAFREKVVQKLARSNNLQ